MTSGAAWRAAPRRSAGPTGAPAPWPPELGEEPWLTAHRRVVVPEQRLSTPRDLNMLVATLLALRAQMGEGADEGQPEG